VCGEHVPIELNPQRPSRLQSIDLLRGAVMIIMALDHIRDFVHSGAGHFRPEDLANTTAALFFTRWITHFCAPVFMFTAGLGAFLRGQRGRGKSEISRFLLTRGLWLMLLEVTFVRFSFYFRFDSGPVLLIILWALGGSMVALAGLVYLPMGVLAGVSIAMIALHDLLDGVQAAQFGGFAWAWRLLHQPGPFSAGGLVFVAGYPLIPWVGVMAAGYCLGPVLLLEEDRRRSLLIRLGIALTLAFIVLRGLNGYGDPAPWSRQASPLFTVLSFLNCAKYPPSLDFLLMTLGPAIAALGWLDRVRVGRRNPVLVFGRTPLFYFLLHFPLIHAIAILLAVIRYGSAGFVFNAPPSMGAPMGLYPPDYGYGLWVCYAVWLAVTLLLYPVCAWFAEFKQRRRDWWLGYL
jgi:uncharacterized membrane protein